MNYEDFLEGKRHRPANYGIEPHYLPDGMFDYQQHVTEYAIRKGRCAVFLDTGMGKTLIELTVAKNYREHTGKPTLILTPLAVAFQFIKEAAKFGITDIQYSKDGKHEAGIVVCNYERLDKFNSNDFGCVILDESSILKNFDGAIKAEVTQFMRKVGYRYLFTATPSPNDFVELGTSSEALGYMGHTDMLGRFFTNNEGGTLAPQNIGTKWILKGHAVDGFFAWVSSWSVSARKPSDIGFDDSRHVLPALQVVRHSVKNDENLVVDGQIQLFNQIARRLTEVRVENKQTVQKRCDKAAELASQHDLSVVWCNFNNEGDLLERIIPNAVQISGGMSIDDKEAAIQWFLGEKCLCGSKLMPKLAACGKRNMPTEDAPNMQPTQANGSVEDHRDELLKKTPDTWPNTTSGIQSGSVLMKTGSSARTKPDGSSIEATQSTGSNVSEVHPNGQRTTQKKGSVSGSKNTALTSTHTPECLPNKVEGVPFVDASKVGEDYTLTIATTKGMSEDYCAANVTLGSDNSQTALNDLSPLPCTCGHVSGVRRLVSKPKILGFGLNFQHCAHTVYFPTFSYEQYYQSIRRFWRFGQQRPVTVDLVFSDGQQRVLDSLVAKTEKANELFDKLNSAINSNFKDSIVRFDQPVQLPVFMR